MSKYYNLIIAILLFLLSSVLSNTFAINNTDFLNEAEHQFWFDIEDVPTMELVFAEEQWQQLLTSTQDNREEVSGSLIYFKNNQNYQLDNIGIKVSGNTSFTLPESANDPYIQANFTLDFDEFVDKQTLSGISALKLKRFHNDNTYVHEPLSNHIMQNFEVFTAHSSTYIKLNISIGNRATAYYGVYRINESVNRREYLDKRFGTDNDGGFLWQGNYKSWGPAHFSRITADWGGVGDFDEASFEYKSKGSKYDKAHAQLVDFAQNITQLEGSEFETYAQEHINIPLFLRGLASEAVLGHWDGFWGNGNNYFVYFDESQVMHFIPYDTDNALGTSLIVADSGKQDPINFASTENTPLLVSKILSIEPYLQQYKDYIEMLVTQDNLMVENYAVDWIQKVHLSIKDDVVNVTGDNEIIQDRPAYWGNQSDYRLFDFSTGNNWYETRSNAVAKAIGNNYSRYDTVYYRGVTNQWGTSLMTEIETNIWTINVVNDEATNADGEPRFKFDIFADWSKNFGDDDGDGHVELDGANILFNDGFGEYVITFDAATENYSVVKHTEPLMAPIANAGVDIEITVGETAHFNASLSSDADGDIISYHWSNGLTGVTPSSLYSQAGHYDITLTVTDNDQQVATDTMTLTVKEKNVTTPNNSSGGSLVWLISFLFIILTFRKNK
ncbi:MAG: CotH kinase family protein [Colwellia sp.]